MSNPLEKRLNDYPRIELTRTPTPLQYLPNLSDSLNLKIYIKRDDLTDLALGGDTVSYTHLTLPTKRIV